MKVPQLRKKPEIKSCHNITWEDNYSWIHQKNILEVLKDKDKLNPEVRDYLNQENEHTEYHLKDTKNLQKKIFNEIKGRIKLDDESLPYKDHTYEYWTKTTETGNYSIKLRKKIGSDLVEEIWNGDKEKEKLGVEYFGIGDLEVSNNDKKICFLNCKRLQLHLYREGSCVRICDNKRSDLIGLFSICMSCSSQFQKAMLSN